MVKIKKILYYSSLIALLIISIATLPAKAQQEEGSIGVEGRIGGEPPQTAATITVPSNGQVFTELPITVSGICPGNVLVKLFKNNVFGGSAQCINGSYSITTDLFSGQNQLVARVYDALDQAGPDSNTVTVTFNDPSGVSPASRPTLTSNYAKRGANPGKTLTWPIVLSGGQGPYAVSVDWGDGKPSDLFTREFAGTFDIKHVYDSPGTYNIVVRVSDANRNVAFLQLVGVANGPLSQTGDEEQIQTIVSTRILWQPFLILLPLLPIGFWLGKKYQIKRLRARIEHGEAPW